MKKMIFNYRMSGYERYISLQLRGEKIMNEQAIAIFFSISGGVVKSYRFYKNSIKS